jgi:uncharacterized repeat protein (TIGR01451 family)
MKTKTEWLLAVPMMLLAQLALAAGTPLADLSITNTTMPRPATVRKNLTYGMNVINHGPDTATNVQVSDTLPAGVNLSGASFNFPGGMPMPCRGTTIITCDIGTLEPSEGVAVIIVVLPQQTTDLLSNTSMVTATEEDPDPSNNTATVETPVVDQVLNPVVEDPNLMVTPVVTGLTTPSGIAFLAPNDFLVTEQTTGRVKRVVDGVVQPELALDLAVNFFSERGLLSIALHSDFESNGFVYLYWTCRAPSFSEDCAGGTDDTSDPAQVALLGNRVDRFTWDGSTLTMDRNIIRLRSYQADAGQPLRGNHNGGKVLFGPDGKLYIYIGDNGRRGWMQNLTIGYGPDGMDDQFGGPETDDAHLTGVVIRLNDDGTTPEDNPFFNAELPPGTSEEVRANIQKVFAYGIRNGFGLAFDPATDQLWESQNGDDSGSEINRIEAGFNGGWIQIQGLLDFIADFKAIETSPVYFGLQQIRWPPTLIADSPEEARDRLFMLPGARYTDPLLTWKFEDAPAGFGFVVGQGLGPEFEGNLIVGGARNFLLDGHLFRLKLSEDRLDLAFDDPLLEDRRADNFDKWDITESESLLFGRGFGITTDIRTGPNGNLFVVGLEKGAVYEISRRTP